MVVVKCVFSAKKKLSVSDILQQLMSEEDQSDVESEEESLNKDDADDSDDSDDEFFLDQILNESGSDTEIDEITN